MNEVAIVTGGARGIGKAIVKKLAEKKITVIANYNNSEKEAIDLKEEFEKKNIKIEIIKADVSQKDECIKLVNYVLNKYGKIDILINNAGISKVQLIDEVTVKDWNEMINTNLYSAFCMCQLVIPGMIKRKKGNIINISSIWGIVGASQEILYSITKAGMNGLTKGLAKEVGPSNIRVNSIAPGCIDTDMNKELTKEDINQIIDETPLERIGKPEDIAECVEWLIKDNFTTGQVISINGGWYIT
ncbi:MAG: elongation factor P 5-aminopentanone reductase [Clostridia bacterium]